MEAKDLIIIGGGPAGLTAGLYACRSRLNVILIEKAITGGQVMTTELIENYPGFPEGISGPELAQKFYTHALNFGLEKLDAEVIKIEIDGKIKKITLDSGEVYRAKTIILATGANPRKLGVTGEDKLRGRGVSYCATCDGAFFKNKRICIVGGGDTAVEEAIYLTKFVTQLYIIHRREQLRATKIIQERAFTNPKIKIIWNSVVESINGDESVESVNLKNVKTNEIIQLPLEGVFVFVGYDPNTEFVKDILKLDQQGYVIVNDILETSASGIFAAGDVNNRFLKQVSTAVGDGATAAVAAEKYIEEHFS
jgi:thioredoxin reductase (NADPH)